MLVFISPIPISMISGMWSDGLWISGWSICRPKPELPRGRKMRSMTELVSCGLLSRTDRWSMEERSNNRVILRNDVLKLSRRIDST